MPDAPLTSALSAAIPRSVELALPAGSTDELGAKLRELLSSHDLVVMRGAGVEDQELVRLGSLLGRNCSELKRFVTEGPTGPAGQSRWHHVGNLAGNNAADATLMAIREFPQSGGEFELVSNRLAWRQLAPEEQSRLRPLTVQHDFSTVRHTTARTDDPSRKAVLPLLMATDGEPYLFLGFHAARIIELEEAESRSLLDDLMSRATRKECVYRHRWQPGDLLAWRNIPLMHHSLGFDAPSRRAMHEVTIRHLAA